MIVLVLVVYAGAVLAGVALFLSGLLAEKVPNWLAAVGGILTVMAICVLPSVVMPTMMDEARRSVEVAIPGTDGLQRSCFVTDRSADFGEDCRVKTLLEAEAELPEGLTEARLICYHGNEVSQHEYRTHIVGQPESDCESGRLGW